MRWKPNITVASIIEQDNKFLMVEEITNTGIKINQPAGHIEVNESIIEGSIRETLEETLYRYSPEFIVGIYKWKDTVNNTTYIRFTFSGKIIRKEKGKLDINILRSTWLTKSEIILKKDFLRSPIILRSIDDYLDGKRTSLNTISEIDDI